MRSTCSCSLTNDDRANEGLLQTAHMAMDCTWEGSSALSPSDVSVWFGSACFLVTGFLRQCPWLRPGSPSVHGYKHLPDVFLPHNYFLLSMHRRTVTYLPHYIATNVILFYEKIIRNINRNLNENNQNIPMISKRENVTSKNKIGKFATTVKANRLNDRIIISRKAEALLIASFGISLKGNTPCYVHTDIFL